ncbi:MAG: PIN domain-containing protein [Bacilli bacterium]
MENKVVWIDTNVIIYFLKKNRDFSPAVRKLVAESNAGALILRVTPIVISECVFVLMGKQFNAKKQDVANSLLSFIHLKGIELEEREVVEQALIEYSKKGVDFEDAYIAEHAKKRRPPHVVSVNVKDFRKLGVLIQTPDELLNHS